MATPAEELLVMKFSPKSLNEITITCDKEGKIFWGNKKLVLSLAIPNKSKIYRVRICVCVSDIIGLTTPQRIWVQASI